MPLDVFVQSNASHPIGDGQYEHIFYFDGDKGYYWFLYPLFQQLKAKTGQDIDLYGGAVFGADNLDDLKQTIARARQLTTTQPETWEVVTGVQTHPEYKEICCSVSRAHMLALLDKLQYAIDKAQQTNWYVTFWGD